MNKSVELKIDSDLSITEQILESSHKQGFITELTINEVPEGFYLTVTLTWSGTKVWYLTTRREKDTPRIFKNLDRLNEYLKDKVFTEEVKIVRK
ncbi:hypothetical protein R4576_18350 [Acinetobacter baumannii]|nr:hypothetical protein [Acinetobacter baumannii]